MIRECLEIREQSGMLTYLSVSITDCQLWQAKCRLLEQRIQEHFSDWQVRCPLFYEEDDFSEISAKLSFDLPPG